MAQAYRSNFFAAIATAVFIVVQCATTTTPLAGLIVCLGALTLADLGFLRRMRWRGRRWSVVLHAPLVLVVTAVMSWRAWHLGGSRLPLSDLHLSPAVVSLLAVTMGVIAVVAGHRYLRFIVRRGRPVTHVARTIHLPWYRQWRIANVLILLGSSALVLATVVFPWVLVVRLLMDWSDLTSATPYDRYLVLIGVPAFLVVGTWFGVWHLRTFLWDDLRYVVIEIGLRLWPRAVRPLIERDSRWWLFRLQAGRTLGSGDEEAVRIIRILNLIRGPAALGKEARQHIAVLIQYPDAQVAAAAFAALGRASGPVHLLLEAVPVRQGP
jgi:hypothetical protein